MTYLVVADKGSEHLIRHWESRLIAHSYANRLAQLGWSSRYFEFTKPVSDEADLRSAYDGLCLLGPGEADGYILESMREEQDK